MRQIPATNADVVFLVDDEDFDHLSQFRWRLNNGYAHSGGPRMCMHRYILSVLCGFDMTGMTGDHANRVGTDNQRHNLRVATPTQNNGNRPKQSNNTSGYKGVIRSKDKWQARIGRRYIGRFVDPMEAAVAYDLYAKQTFGTFALLNFDTPPPELVQRVVAALANPKKRTGRSKYRGVSFYKAWKARVKQNGRQVHLGYFKIEEDAARAVDEATIRLDLGRPLNFPST